MTVLVLLAAFLAVTGWLAPRQLARSAWAPRAPRAAITTWAALILACAANVVMLAHRLITADHHGRGPFGWLLPAASAAAAGPPATPRRSGWAWRSWQPCPPSSSPPGSAAPAPGAGTASSSTSSPAGTRTAGW
ncbi:hypothetical protein ACFQ1I_37650 [Kitasatospora arboriphila]